MILLLLKFFLTSILFSLIIGAGLIKIKGLLSSPQNEILALRPFELFLYSLGLGPIFTVLLLYYLLLLIPKQSYLFYILVILGIYGLVVIFSFKGFQEMWFQLKKGIESIRFSWPNTAYWMIIIILIGMYLFFYLGNTIQTPLEHHDALIYGNLGKLYYQQKEINYSNVMKPAKNGFFFQGSQKPSFSLLLTWEMMINNKATNQGPEFDIYFRSISGYYGLLLIAICFYWLYRKNKYLALLGLLLLFSGLRFFIMMVNYHLDAYRIFFLTISWIFLVYTIKHKDNFSLLLMGIFTGFTAFTHLIGLVVAVFNVFVLFIFYEGDMKTKFQKASILTLLIVCLGNIHYLLEAFFGSVSGFLTYISE